MFPKHLKLLPALIVLAAGLLLPGTAAAALAVPPVDQPNQTNQPNQPNQPEKLNRQGVNRILKIARKQLRSRVSERRSDNVPRYRNGKGRIVPFSIKDQWCVAFGTWVWNRAGFRDYLGTKYIWKAFGGTRVAVQVTDMSNWAMETGHWSARAKPGYLVAYDFSHIGIVTRANRQGQAVWAIEGNKGDRVRKVRVPMANVTGYISPVVLSNKQIVNAIANPDMEVPEEITEAPHSFVREPEAFIQEPEPFSGPNPAE